MFGLRWLKLFLHPISTEQFGHISESDRRSYILGRLEGSQPSEWSWVVVVAGVGFFTDAYSIFAINMVIPILGIVYYDGQMPHNYEIALSVVTLGGSLIGQVAFGLGADIWGRRKMYGLELIITISATVGMVMSSNGIDGSMSLIVWLLVWRFVLGIGIGAEQVAHTIYPLSAVICAEFAPTRLRGRMLTLVFACQPIGQLAATLVALIAVVRQRNGIPSDALIGQCNMECKKTLDSVWRWILGVGVIPAVIALWFRLTIIESPRYTADVERDSNKAATELESYLLIKSQPILSATSSSISLDQAQGAQENYRMRRGSSGAASGVASDAGSGIASGAASILEENHTQQTGENPQHGFKNNHIAITHLPLRNPTSQNQQSPRIVPNGSHNPPLWLHQESLAGLQGENFEHNELPPVPSWREFKDHFWHAGNLRTLLATSFCWFCVDLPFYGLGMNSPKIITTIWYGKTQPVETIYPLLIHNVWQSLVVVSLGALVGCAITFVSIDKLGRRTIQMIGFFWLFILFIVIGGSFNHLVNIGGSPAIIVLYILSQIFFNFGPNTTTYILPSELFPTRYRGLCHGISAAFGKLGSVLAQLFLAYINYGHGINYTHIQKWLPYSLLIFSIFMLLGLITTVLYIPGNESSSITIGQVKTLEEWAGGHATPNGFAEHRLSKIVEWSWKRCAAAGQWLFNVADRISSDEIEEVERQPETEMGETNERERANDNFQDVGRGEGMDRSENMETRV